MRWFSVLVLCNIGCGRAGFGVIYGVVGWDWVG